MSIPSTFTLNFLLQSHMEMVNTAHGPSHRWSAAHGYLTKKEACITSNPHRGVFNLTAYLPLRCSHPLEPSSPSEPGLGLDQGVLQSQVDLLPVLQTLTDPVEVLQRFIPVQSLGSRSDSSMRRGVSSFLRVNSIVVVHVADVRHVVGDQQQRVGAASPPHHGGQDELHTDLIHAGAGRRSDGLLSPPPPGLFSQDFGLFVAHLGLLPVHHLAAGGQTQYCRYV
ncbi:hypothetical protein F7725_021810 [Dissostichus mawsoni]|uniref:Uncharacterized protein n=1 Tax=Dissostichus mawsoni TaxID=36200 RepID=A0A7J5ZE73_DISMA|nr:hypothetical protein F7725_021810 [Dissostichus mawsoni]